LPNFLLTKTISVKIVKVNFKLPHLIINKLLIKFDFSILTNLFQYSIIYLYWQVFLHNPIILCCHSNKNNISFKCYFILI